MIAAMWVVINAGNTNAALAAVEPGRAGELGPTGRIATQPLPLPDELRHLIDGLAEDGPDGLLLASVVPAFSQLVRELAADRSIGLQEISAGSIPIPVRVDAPDEVGADRLVNAFAAGRLYGTPAVVVDLGTATTLDAVARDGAYVGGAIAPGAELGLAALAERTALLPRITLRAPHQAIGRSTVEAMRSGTVFGQVGMVRELLGRVREELLRSESQSGRDTRAGADAGPVHSILTGGHSRAEWAALIPGIDVIDPDLTLKGLALLAPASARPPPGGPVGAGRRVMARADPAR